MENFLTTSCVNEFLPYIYSGYFFPHSMTSGKVNKWKAASPYFLLDLVVFSDIIENDVF